MNNIHNSGLDPFTVSMILELLAGNMTPEEILADYPDLERRTVAMHQNGRAYVTTHQPLLGQLTGPSHSVQFLDCVHNFGSGWALTRVDRRSGRL